MKNPNAFTYHYSKLFNDEYAIHKTKKEVTFKSGVKYTPKELSIITKNIKDIITLKEIHYIKLIFGGEING